MGLAFRSYKQSVEQLAIQRLFTGDAVFLAPFKMETHPNGHRHMRSIGMPNDRHSHQMSDKCNYIEHTDFGKEHGISMADSNVCWNAQKP